MASTVGISQEHGMQYRHNAANCSGYWFMSSNSTMQAGSNGIRRISETRSNATRLNEEEAMEYGEIDYMETPYSFELEERPVSAWRRKSVAQRNSNESRWQPLPGLEALCPEGIQRRGNYRPRQKKANIEARSVWLGLPGIDKEDNSEELNAVQVDKPEEAVKGNPNPRPGMRMPGYRM